MPEASASVARDELVGHLGTLLAVSDFDDYGPNGLQVEGNARINRLATGVSACSQLFERARTGGYDGVLVHHGLFWRKQPMILTGVQYQRVRALIETRTNLLAYHLPLDAHPELGNNALALRALGVEDLMPFGLYGTRPIGFRGHYADGLDVEAFSERCREVFLQAPLLLGHGPKLIRKVALVTGAAQSLLFEAAEAGVDAFVTGEASEWVTHAAAELGIHYVAAGHHATERFGVQALARHVTDTFGIAAQYIEVPNPV